MQPPPPPPLTNQAKCQWCSQPMNSDALRCTHCGKLRKDIYTEKVRCYILCIAGGFLIGLSIALWKSSNPNQFEYDNTSTSGGNTISYVLLALGIIAALGGIYYYVRVSQKMKTWWWA